MNLEERINNDIKAAMLARETLKLEAVRAVKAALLLEKKSGKSAEFTEADSIKMLQKLVKQRKESADIYAQQNRPELAEKELAEAAVISAYLPAQMSETEIEAALKEIIADTGAASAKEMGKVMAVASKQLSGKADGKLIAETVKRLLA